MIPEEIIYKINEAADIVDVISDYVKLKRRGANYIAICPYHEENTPSFTVSPTKNIYKCFSCGRGGDAISFMKDSQGMTYPEVLTYLAEKYSIEIPKEQVTHEEKAKTDRLRSVHIANEYAAKLFHNDLKGVFLDALSYLIEDRGFTETTINNFELGYAGNYIKDLSSAHFKTEVLEDAGLVGSGDSGSYARFANRIIFPIRNKAGRYIGFGGRLFSGKSRAKYINSPDGIAYDKSQVLYGLKQGLSNIRTLNKAHLVEGYTDVCKMHQFGYTNTVASCGTAFTEKQAKLLRISCSNIVLLFDGDKAGKAAILRALPILLKNNFIVKVAPLPVGQDPDSLLMAGGKDNLSPFLDSPLDWFEFIEEEFSGDVIEKVEELIKYIANYQEELHRSHYSGIMSTKYNLPLRDIRFRINQIRKQK